MSISSDFLLSLQTSVFLCQVRSQAARNFQRYTRSLRADWCTAESRTVQGIYALSDSSRVRV